MEEPNRLKFGSNIDLTEIDSFLDIGLKDELLQVLLESNTTMKPVLKYCLTQFISLKSVLIISPTGLGRSLCSMVGVLNSVDSTLQSTQALVLSPNANLAQEYFKDIKALNLTLNLSVAICTPKVLIDHKAFKSQVIIGTCGKILRNIRDKKIDLGHLKVTVCDIADKLFKEPVIFDTEDILNLINKPCVYWYLSPTDKNFIKEKFTARVGESAIVDIYMDEEILRKMSFYVKVVENDLEEAEFVESLVYHNDNQTILFSHNTEQLVEYEKKLGKYSASLLSVKLPSRKQKVVLDDFENEVLKVVICESKGRFVRRIKAKGKTDLVFLDPSKNAKMFLTRLRRNAFNEKDEVFFVIRQEQYAVIQKYVSELGLIVRHY